MDVEIKTVGDVKVLVVPKRFDAYTASAVEAGLSKLVGEEKALKVVCDFSQTDYLASAGLRVLISGSRNLQKFGGKLTLCSVKPFVLEVFEISGLKKVFKICDSTEAAISSF